MGPTCNMDLDAQYPAENILSGSVKSFMKKGKKYKTTENTEKNSVFSKNLRLREFLCVLCGLVLIIFP
jgi:hypothetical protein